MERLFISRRTAFASRRLCRAAPLLNATVPPLSLGAGVTMPESAAFVLAITRREAYGRRVGTMAWVFGVRGMGMLAAFEAVCVSVPFVVRARLLPVALRRFFVGIIGVLYTRKRLTLFLQKRLTFFLDL